MCRGTVGLWLAVLAWSIFSDGGVHADRKLQCNSDHTLMKSFFAYEGPGRTCGQLIGNFSDHFYNPYFIKDCKRWMGEDHPEVVDDYFITQCDELSDGTLKYKADVCCSGPKVMRCFDCQENSAYKCREIASAVQCSDGEVCQTTVKFHGFYDSTTISRTTGCADANVCTNSEINNNNTCKDWLTDPECSYCCKGAHCNYYTPSEQDFLYVGDNPCLWGPCQNGATCEYEPNEERTYTCKCAPDYSGTRCTVCDKCNPTNPCKNGGVCVSFCTSFECQCRVGWTGDTCTINQTLCAEGNDFCLNGGTCYDHGNDRLRCKCPDDHVGERCEIAKVECSVAMTYRPATQLKVKPSTDCTSAFLEEESRIDTEKNLELCARFVSRRSGNRLFENNVDGHVDRLERRSLHECDTGDIFTFSKHSWCCPSCHLMPCQNHGWCTQTKDNEYHCQCREGWYGTHCENRRNSCVISGDPHYTTFDDLLLTFQGAGNYTLVSSTRKADEDFTVTGKNEKVGSVSYLHSIAIAACGHVVELQRNQTVLVDGKKKDPAGHLRIDCIVLRMDGNQVKVQTSYGLTVEYDGVHTGIIDLPIALMGKVQGLCGNFDSEKDNDWIGQDENNYIEDPDKAHNLGKSWEIGESVDMEVEPTLNCTDVADIIISNEYCGNLMDVQGIFSECMADEAVNHETDFESCKYDVCANKQDETAMKTAACDAMHTFVLTCEAAGHIIIWRDITGCPLTCKEGFEYRDSAPACPATCRMPNAPENCELPPKEACVCPEGTLLKNGECIDPTDCGCIDKHGNEFEVGQTWLSEDCELKYSCERGDDLANIEAIAQGCQKGKLCSSPQWGIGECGEYTDPCDKEPCKNGGICETTGWSYDCRCRAGRTGKNCNKAHDLCADGTKRCQNGGTCYHHGKYGQRCKCPPGYVGSKCEFSALTCSDPRLYRLGGDRYVKGKNCTGERKKIQDELNATSGLFWCKRFMQKVFNTAREYVDAVDGNITQVESRSFSTCEEGDTHMFATNDWCCPSCYSFPCLHGGKCIQELKGEYTCKCTPGYSGDNCEIEQVDGLV